jgi:BASS family bile acid:Na+ symporter
MHPVDALRLNFDPDQLAVLHLAMAFLMFAVSLDVYLADFRSVIRFPKSVILGIVVQYLIFPLITLGIIALFRPPVSMALGMVLVSMCPSGNMTNFLAHYAGGNIALSVTLNGILILSAAGLTPAGFWFWSSFLKEGRAMLAGLEIGLADMVVIILQLIVLPLALGMLLRYRAPDLVGRWRSGVQRAALLVFFGVLVMALMGNLTNIRAYLGFAFVIVLVHNATALALGYGLGRAFRLPEADCRTLSFESGVHNTALGLLLIFRFFDGLGGMALIAAWYGIWDLITGYLLARFWRSRPPAASRQAGAVQY